LSVFLLIVRNSIFQRSSTLIFTEYWEGMIHNVDI
jgi:hypothetical protein